MNKNERWNAFLDRLNKNGVFLRCLWSTKTNPDMCKYDDVVMYAVVGGRGGTIVCQDYGADGFGIWHESETISLDDDVLRLITPRVSKVVDFTDPKLGKLK